MTSPAAKTLAVLLLACTPALTACQTDAPGGPVAQASPQEAPKPLTHQEAALQCWMSTEKAHQNLGLDQRADIVTKCIADKMKTPQQPAAAAAKPSKPPKPKT